MTAYYNEIDPYAAAWLRSLIAQGLIADGVVDERSIVDVRPEDLEGFTQCHFFAGIGGWSLALRMSGWPDDKPVWTGSCPCQPFSTAGRQKGKEDERHLWPSWLSLIEKCKPPVIFGEQVAAAIAHGWIDDVADDLENQGYAVGAAIAPACSVGAPHKRDRLWFVGDSEYDGSSGRPFSRSDNAAVCNHTQGENSSCESTRASEPSNVAHAKSVRRTECQQLERGNRPQDVSRASYGCRGSNALSDVADAECVRQQRQGQHSKPFSTTQDGTRETNRTFDVSSRHWQNGIFIQCPDGKQRLIEPSIPLLVNGVPARVGRLRAYGNAIVPQVAATFIKAFQESKRPNRLMEDLIG